MHIDLPVLNTMFWGVGVVACRALMDLQAQLELQDREALWVFPVREESVECQDFPDLRYVSFFFF